MHFKKCIYEAGMWFWLRLIHIMESLMNQDPSQKLWIQHLKKEDITYHTARAVDPDPDPHGSAFIFLSGSGSGSRRVKKCKEIANNCNFIKCLKENLHKLHCFLLLSNLLCFFSRRLTWHVIFTTVSGKELNFSGATLLPKAAVPYHKIISAPLALAPVQTPQHRRKELL